MIGFTFPRRPRLAGAGSTRTSSTSNGRRPLPTSGYPSVTVDAYGATALEVTEPPPDHRVTNAVGNREGSAPWSGITSPRCWPRLGRSCRDRQGSRGARGADPAHGSGGGE